MSDPQTPNVDAVVIGAGFGGIYMLHKLRNGLGLKVRAYDKAGGVGGTWYWNKYPGALSDTEAHIYQYSFDKEMLQAWDWKNRYWNQADILAYLQAVVERHDLAKDIQLNTNIESLVFNDASNSWTVTTGDGETVTARHVDGFDRCPVHLCGLEARRAPDCIPAVGTVQRPERQRPSEQRVREKNQSKLRPDLGAGPQLIRRIRLPGEQRPGDERLGGGA